MKVVEFQKLRIEALEKRVKQLETLGTLLLHDNQSKKDKLEQWQSGKITLFNGGSVEEWVELGRPKNPNI
tara:strand:- start:11314 stop:11523 length:210 start_codon:yes stop_codon:yes gene_type:complete